MAHHGSDSASCKTLLVTAANLLDDSAEAAADRELLRALGALGLPCEAVGRFAVLAEGETEPAPWLAERGWADAAGTGAFPLPEDLESSAVRADAKGVPVTLHRGATTRPHAADEAERAGFLRLVEAALADGHPEVVLVRSGPWAAEVLAAARARGVATVALQADCTPRDPAAFKDADVVLTPSRFVADYLRGAFGLPCEHLPPVVASGPVAGQRETAAVVFDATAPGGGLIPFAQIAEELGHRRPDLSVVVIGAEGSLPMPRGGKVTCVPRSGATSAWTTAAVCVAPQVAWEHPPRAALTALGHGVPVVASDRGGAAELLGGAATTLPLPDRVTTAFAGRLRPEEVAAWADAVLRFFDDPAFAGRQRAEAALARERLSAGELAPEYARLLGKLVADRPQPGTAAPPPARGGWVVLVPHLNGIEWECEQALRKLESAGVRVVRRGGCSAIDAARNELVSDALHDGAESILFIDSDIGFDPADALRLLARPEPVACGIYAKKGMRELASVFADGVKELLFGPDAAGAYPLKYAATGFLRMKAAVLRRMIAELKMPLCNTRWGRGMWPFFQPLIVPNGPAEWHYLGEDWAFSYRLTRVGVTPVADTSIRLWHWGRYGFGWEDAGRTAERYRSYTYRLATS